MKRDKSRQGAALVTVLIVVVLMTLAGATVINLASQQSYAANRVREQVKAQALAEAGANEAYSILKADFSQRESDTAFPEKQFEDGTYDATVTPVGNDMALISCAAGCGAVAATVMCDVKDYNPSAGAAESRRRRRAPTRSASLPAPSFGAATGRQWSTAVMCMRTANTG